MIRNWFYTITDKISVFYTNYIEANLVVQENQCNCGDECNGGWEDENYTKIKYFVDNKTVRWMAPYFVRMKNIWNKYHFKYKLLLFSAGMILHSTYHYLPVMLRETMDDSKYLKNDIIISTLVPILVLITSILCTHGGYMIISFVTCGWLVSFVLLSRIEESNIINSHDTGKTICTFILLLILEYCRSLIFPYVASYIVKQIGYKMSKQSIGTIIACIISIIIGEKIVKSGGQIALSKFSILVTVSAFISLQSFIWLMDKNHNDQEEIEVEESISMNITNGNGEDEYFDGEKKIKNETFGITNFCIGNIFFLVFIANVFILGTGKELAIAYIITYQLNFLKITTLWDTYENNTVMFYVNKVIGPYGLMRSFCICAEIICIYSIPEITKRLEKQKDTNSIHHLYIYLFAFIPIVISTTIYLTVPMPSYTLLCLSEFLRGITNYLGNVYGPIITTTMIKNKNYKFAAMAAYNMVFFGINKSLAGSIMLYYLWKKENDINNHNHTTYTNVMHFSKHNITSDTFKSVFITSIIVLTIGILALLIFTVYYNKENKEENNLNNTIEV
ncbi:hypothetical protein SLOPH_1168 [Spraguea lophii 42_110]|uniref:Uncharacterized protein n=1 Tax=Spraguea lophii (strain 42_110) TaxID=1358809 RepID=S7XH81_SPRLO|nr:hypothetical protein SLOPH_1168 [Spraguea lophii 42_110]